VLAGLVALATLGLAACAETYDHGYIISDEAISQIQTGSSREQVLLALGTPSTTATIGGEAFYYISQHAERMVAFLDQRVTDQKVLAVYFDDKGQVKEVANYGLKDGKVFDFIGRKTKTGGGDYGFLTQIMNAGPANPFVSNQ
jgi:outer membrane protein assembly factor BamE (lipoprotein component of BamABCDE complex)